MTVTDFLITMMTLYPWFTWLVAVFFAVTVAFWLLLGIVGVKSVLDWSEMKREDRRILADILARAHSDPPGVRQPFRAGDVLPSWGDRPITQTEASDLNKRCGITDDPPEYQHPDGDERFEVTRTWRPESGEDWIPDDDGPDWDGPPDDWSPAAEWGEKPGRSLGTLAEVLARARELAMMNDDDQLPDGPPVNAFAFRLQGESAERCNNADCYRYGERHGGACDVAPTMPAACYTEGPAMPPQPVREYLHPRIMDDLSAAGFSEHETTDGAVESMFTRAQAREVQAMITDGVIPGGQEK